LRISSSKARESPACARATSCSSSNCSLMRPFGVGAQRRRLTTG
jgi:hypothetical protein